jgi:DNA-binding NarL/FixJ family response regulator
MDLKMPVMNGIQATRQIRKNYPATRVLVLTTYEDDEWLFDAIRSGAAGYLLKDTPREQLIAALHGTMTGDTYIDPQVAGKLFTQITPGKRAEDQEILAGLSEREQDVLKLMARGLTNADIAQQLYLSEGTVRNYVSTIFAKLQVTDRTQAAVIALRNGLVDLSEI